MNLPEIAMLDRLSNRDFRTAGRLVSAVESQDPGVRFFLDALAERVSRAYIIGITGSPGVGKSTVIAAIAEQLSERFGGLAILAIDPSSKLTGGAILGDRVRMESLGRDPSIFIRSMGARGLAGGLNRAILDVLTILSAMRFDAVVVETVGAGQGDTDIADVADTTVVVLSPDDGDDVQMMKSGVMEIGDVYVVNKAADGRGERKMAELKRLLGLMAHGSRAKDRPDIVATDALTGEGLSHLCDSLVRRQGGGQ